jgi:hypothetical protein
VDVLFLNANPRALAIDAGDADADLACGRRAQAGNEHHLRIEIDFDLGDGDLSNDGGPVLGSIEGSFSRNWAVMLDIQLRKVF